MPLQKYIKINGLQKLAGSADGKEFRQFTINDRVYLVNSLLVLRPKLAIRVSAERVNGQGVGHRRFGLARHPRPLGSRGGPARPGSGSGEPVEPVHAPGGRSGRAADTKP
jgi:hypothetical protein